MSVRRRLILLLIGAFLLGAPATLNARGWEPVKSERQDAKTVLRDSAIEIKTLPGMIVVTANHQTPIKIFTILGRLVNSETLPAGTMQFILPAHGVYIVKAGDTTCKVAV